MAIARFLSLEEVETIEISFLKPQGGEVSLRLLVDSGFTGESSFVISKNTTGLAYSIASPMEVAGALQGRQKRIMVRVKIPLLSVEFPALAIQTNTTSLALPPTVDGMAGLQFLRHFQRWGSEKIQADAWQFFLETKDS